MQRVINFSGGKSSALMTILNYRQGDIVLFTDTKLEHPKTYKFINDFEAYENIPVHRAIYTHKSVPGLEGFEALVTRKKYLPNRVQRICTTELKVLTAKRYLRSVGVRRFESLIGFRADEQRRVDKYDNRYTNVYPKFPLYEDGFNKAMVEDYWLKKPYTLEIPSILGNCTLCFLKGQNAIISLMQHYPELAEPWIEMENMATKKAQHKTPPTFINGVSYSQLLKYAQSQKTLFDIESTTPAFSCSCTS